MIRRRGTPERAARLMGAVNILGALNLGAELALLGVNVPMTRSAPIAACCADPPGAGAGAV